MENPTFFVRSRGKVSGPFDRASLQKLVRRGALSRMHEISPDRAAWASAGDFEDLFPTKVIAAEILTAPQPGTASSVGPDASEVFYYAHRGSTVGPVSTSVLLSLARNGSLMATDPVWPEGGQTANPAAQLPALAAIFSDGGLGGGSNSRLTASSESDRRQNKLVLNRTSAMCQVAGIVVGFVLLLFLNLPLGSMFDKSAAQDKMVWWWDVLKRPGNGTLDILLFFVLFTALISGIVGASVRGLIRAWIFVGVASLSIILFLVTGLQGVTVDEGFFFGLLVPYLAAALAGVSYFRAKAPHAKIGVVFQAIFGGSLLLSTLIVAIVGLAENSGTQLRSIFGTEQLPGWLVLSLTIGSIGTAAALTAGILGLVGLKKNFSPAVNWTGVCCAAVSIILPFIAILIAMGGVFGTQDSEKTGQFLFLSFRILTVFCGFLVLMGIGLAEVFITSHCRGAETDIPLTV